MDLNPILFQSDPRWLGPSLANDFSMFGAQPVIAFAPDGKATDAPPVRNSDDIGSGTNVSEPITPLPATSYSGSAVADVPEAASTSPPAASAPAGTQAVDTAPAFATSPLIPATYFPDQVAGDSPINSVGSQVDAIDDGTDPASASIGDLGASDAILSNSLLQAPLPVAPALATSVLDIVPAITSSVLQPVGNLVEDVTDTLQATVEALPLDALVAAPTALVGGLGETVGELVDNLPIQDLLGSDPVAGVATLVNLVTVSDVIDLQDAGAPADASLAGNESPFDPLLDTLTADPIVLPLNTDDDDEPADGLLPLDVPDLGLGL